MEKKSWTVSLEAALKKAAAKCGANIEGLKWEHCTTDNTWGDRVGLVYYGAAPEVCERAAKYAEAWMAKNLRKLGVVGGYDAQESIGYVGVYHYTAWSNKACAWSKGPLKSEDVIGHKPYKDLDLVCTEVRTGHATSYVYYPGAD